MTGKPNLPIYLPRVCLRVFVLSLAAGVLLAAGCGGGAADVRSPGVSQHSAVWTISHHGRVAGKLLVGRDAMGDWRSQSPGVRRLIRPSDLPPPYTTGSANNFARVIPRPHDAWPKTPAGFRVDLFATGLTNPRKIVTAPNGDIFVAESQAGRIRVLRAAAGAAHAARSSVFASGLWLPFGIAFYPPGPDRRYVYVAETGMVVRYPYRNGDLAAAGPKETVTDLSAGGRLPGGVHWTRDIVFSGDGSRMFVSVGSRTNDYEKGPAAEEGRADILEFNPDGAGRRTSSCRPTARRCASPSITETNSRMGIGVMHSRPSMDPGTAACGRATRW